MPQEQSLTEQNHSAGVGKPASFLGVSILACLYSVGHAREHTGGCNLGVPCLATWRRSCTIPAIWLQRTLTPGRFLHSLHFSAFPYSASLGLGPKHAPICSSRTYSSVIATPSRTYMYPESRIRASRLLMSPFLNNNSHCGLEPRMSCSHRSALPQNAPFICRARVLGAGVGVPSRTKCYLKITSEESTSRPLVMSSAPFSLPCPVLGWKDSQNQAS